MPTTVEPAVFAGERLRAARVLIGASQAELAAAVGVSQAQVSHVESGRRTATSDLVDRVAAATDFPRSFFDAVPADLPPLTLRFRRRATARSNEVRRAEQLVAETYRVVWQMLHGAGRYIPPSLPLATDETQDPSDIERYAEHAREALGLDAASPVRHVTRNLERSGIVVAPLVFSDVEDESETVGHFGASCWPGAPDPAVIGFIDPTRRTSLFKQLSARGWRRHEPVAVHPEHPTLLAKLIGSQFGTGMAGYRRAADTLGLPAFTLATLAPP